jgi:general secretion pathway protein B
MSYILDALKKSDKERQRGAVPDISTVHAPARPKTKRRPIWLYVLSAGLLLNAGVLVWWFGFWRPLDQSPRATRQTAQPVPPPQTDGTSHGDRLSAQSGAAARSSPIQNGAPQKDAATSDNRIAQGPQPAQVTPQQKKTGAVTEQKRAVTVPKDTTPRTTHDRAAETDTTSERTSAPPIPPPIANKLYTVGELPEALRQNLPAFTISVALYSEDAASRMVRINDQVVREGQYLSAGLRLEEITRDSVILNYQNYRFRVGLK